MTSRNHLIKSHYDVTTTSNGDKCSTRHPGAQKQSKTREIPFSNISMEFRSFQVACSSLCVVYDVTVEIPAVTEGGLRFEMFGIYDMLVACTLKIFISYFFYFGFFYKQILISSSCGVWY